MRVVRHEGIQRDQPGRILDEKSVKMLYSHVARGVQRGITTRVTPLVVLIVEEAPRATFPLLSAISDDLRENNLTLTLNVPVSSPRNTSPRAPRHFRYPVISLLAAVRNRRAAVEKENFPFLFF